MSVIVTLALVLTVLIGPILGAVVLHPRRLLRPPSSFARRLLAAQGRDCAPLAPTAHSTRGLSITGTAWRAAM